MIPSEASTQSSQGITDHQTQQASQSEKISANAPPSYVKLAMRNMVKKGGKSLFHFALSAIGLLSLLIGLAYLTR